MVKCVAHVASVDNPTIMGDWLTLDTTTTTLILQQQLMMINKENSGSTRYIPITVFCGTWNVNATKPEETSIESLCNWLCPDNKPMVGGDAALHCTASSG